MTRIAHEDDLVVNDFDTWVGLSTATLGSTGLAIHLWLPYLSVAAVGLNMVLALGGLYLLYLRIKRLRRLPTKGGKDT